MDGCIGVFEVVKFHTKRHRAESGHLPSVGERIACVGWIFEVVDLDGKRIDKVLALREN